MSRQCLEHLAEDLYAHLQHWLEDDDLDRILKNYDDNQDGEQMIHCFKSIIYSPILTGTATTGILAL